MLSAGIEPATFPLGGERSILLSYESQSNFGFWNANYEMSNFSKFAEIMFNRRMPKGI